MAGVAFGGRYAIEREVGRGGMATVWLAYDRQHQRRVAIKTLHAELAGAVGVDRFLREIRLTAELQHPAIVPILDSGTVDLDGVPVPWYAMPFLEGESLRQRLNRETQLAIDEALRIVAAVGQALEAAHQRNIIHRDIKPENIFLSGQQVYVVDFGVAKAIADTGAERLTSSGIAIGTPAYMSPEQAMARAVDARSDQYSLAAVLYEMLAGEPPFAGPNQQATMARRLAEPARPISTVRSTVPPGIERATLRALERTPADRFASVGAFVDALDMSVMPRGQGGGKQRLRTPLVAVIAIGLVLVASGAWAVINNRPSTWHLKALASADQGDLGKALDGWRRSVRLDPQFTTGLAHLAMGHYWRGDYDSAAVWVDSAIHVNESDLFSRQTAGVVDLARSRFADAETEAGVALQLAKEDVDRINSQLLLALVKARAGNDLSRVDLLVAEVASGGLSPMPPHTALALAEARTAVSDLDGAVKALGMYSQPRDAHFQLHMRCSPTFAPLEQHAGFVALLVIPRPARGSHC